MGLERHDGGWVIIDTILILGWTIPLTAFLLNVIGHFMWFHKCISAMQICRCAYWWKWNVGICKISGLHSDHSEQLRYGHPWLDNLWHCNTVRTNKKCCTNQPLKNLPYRPSKCQADKWQSDGSDGRAHGRGHRRRCRTWIRALILRTGTDASIFIESAHQWQADPNQARICKMMAVAGVGPISTH